MPDFCYKAIVRSGLFHTRLFFVSCYIQRRSVVKCQGHLLSVLSLSELMNIDIKHTLVKVPSPLLQHLVSLVKALLSTASTS
jgi:hypothetical protein